MLGVLVRDVAGCWCVSVGVVSVLVCLRLFDVEVLVTRLLLEGWRDLDVEF